MSGSEQVDSDDADLYASSGAGIIPKSADNLIVSEKTRAAQFVFLACTVDGHVHALDRFTGRVLWSTEEALGGSLVRGNSFKGDEETSNGWALSNEAYFLVEPLYPGSLYMFVPGEMLQKMPISIKSLVNQSPVRWADGTMFLGRRHTEFYVLDLATGRRVLKFGDDAVAPPEEALKEVMEAPERFIFLGRTEYQVTAYRLDGPPKKMVFAELSGLRDPSFMWKQRPDGKFSEFEGGVEPQVVPDADQSIYSSFAGTVYARSRKTGRLLWARQLSNPVITVLRTSTEENSGADLVPLSAFPSLDLPRLVQVPIERLTSEELPDERGEISHPLDVPMMTTRASEDEEYGLLVNVGELEGTLFVLPHSRFPRFRAPLKTARERKESNPQSPSKGTALMRKQPNEFLWAGQPCFPSDPDWPYCLLSNPQFPYEQVASPLLLEAGDRIAIEAAVSTRAIRTAIIGILAALLGFFASRIRNWLRPRQQARLSAVPPPPVKQTRPFPRREDLSNASSTASQRSRPPGFEEITLTSADYFYQAQDYLGDTYHEEEDPNVPRSFTVTDQVLGYGSHGTVVFKGLFDGREVAVKRMLIDFYNLAGHEVSLLQQSDSHPNVIRYFCREQTERFMYILLELCPASLADAIENPESPPVMKLFPAAKPMDKQKVLREIVLGLEHLHISKLVHRDLKPANILIAPNRRVLLSDFGLSKRLADGQSSFHATVQSGTIGWRAPECILNDEVARLSEHSKPDSEMPRGIKITKAIDIFAAGCVFYYVLTGGKHPFGTRMLREMNIVQNHADISELHNQPLAMDLVSRMIARDPAKRPTAHQILSHPFFWEASKRLSFLLDVSDFLERENRHSHPTNRALEACRPVIYNGQAAWNTIVDQLFWDDLSNFRKYFGNSVQDLLRAMRNKRHHFQELTPELKSLLGESAEAYLNYFESHFPKLVIQVYLIIEASPFRASHPFRDVYFSDDMS